jgi:septal ring-binding cell division protein DamX
VSGPAPRPARARPLGDRPARRPREETGIALGLIESLGRLSRNRLLDRLIQGRISIALVAFALIGIVTMQLGLLKLNAGIGRALERTALLQRENAALSIENSEMAAGDRVELQAARLGMELVAPGALHFLAARPSIDASRGAVALSTPVNTSTTEGSAEAPVAGSGTAVSLATESSNTTASTESSTATAAPTTAESSTATAAPTTAESSTATAAPTTAVSPTTASATSPATEASAPPAAGPSGGAGEAASSPASTGGGAVPSG